MAANTCTSSTGTVTGSDNAFVLTYKTNANDGVVLYVKYTQGTDTGITITFDTKNPSLNAGSALTSTDVYRLVSLSGTALSAYTMVITATGNYRIPIPLLSSEKEVVANITFSSAAKDGAVVANFMEE